MPRLTAADGDQVDAVYRESHLLWGSGLGFDSYRALWDELSRTEWGRHHAGFYAWVGDDGGLLSSVKLYRPRMRIGEITARVTVIGALFTPAHLRGRGHASELVEAVLAAARERGDPLVILFSDIGTKFYEPFGFRPLPAVEQWARLPLQPPAPAGCRLQPLTARALPAVVAAHRIYCEQRPFAVLRDETHWEYLRVRSGRFFERLSDGALRQRELIALAGERFVGYLIAVEGRGEWHVREVGAAGGDLDTMAAILRLGAHGAREAGLRAMYGWLPPGVADRLAGWAFRERARRRALPMVAPLDAALDLTMLERAESAYLPFQDQF